MKKLKHSTGWYTVKDLTTKIKIQRIVIAMLLFLLVFCILFCFLRGR